MTKGDTLNCIISATEEYMYSLCTCFCIDSESSSRLMVNVFFLSVCLSPTLTRAIYFEVYKVEMSDSGE